MPGDTRHSKHPKWHCSPVQAPRSDAVCTLTGLHLGCKCGFVRLSSIHNLHVLEITGRTEHPFVRSL
jgi:hypothetical protein